MNEDKKEQLLRDLIEQLQELNERLQYQNDKINKLQLTIKQKDEFIIQTQELVNHFATGKLMQLNHLLFRLKGQYLKGNAGERAEFKSWLKGRIKKTNRSIGEGSHYNPWMVVNGKLNEALNCYINMEDTINQPISEVQSTDIFNLEKSVCDKISQKYIKYDVIFLSVIDYNFRHQRPQHFASRFAANGHRVFYINANFVRPDTVNEIEENLYIVDFNCKEHNAVYTMEGRESLPWLQEKMSRLLYSQGIRDAVVIVDYPNWVYGAEYLRTQYGFKIITDYMDDFTGFLGTAEEFLKANCIHLLETSDLVVASSQFLYDVSSKYTERDKIRIIRNGTEVEHFYRAFGRNNNESKRKTIGYYGAVAHWFAWEKICYLAKNMPECDIVIIGEVTEHRDKLEIYSNIKLLGEKKYSELPEYLAYFDVCLIPFDTSTDLIKATNPVKFYEYLSAGKKVVATEIPELMPFKDEYVYMSNDDEEFMNYVKICLNNTDHLKSGEECLTFAKENDWQKRYELFSIACKQTVPMTSIIVLTYNNLDLNKACIQSILINTAYPNYELIIVDNQSTDGTREYLEEIQKRNYPQVKIIFNHENAGFAGGNNIGMKEAHGKYILLLNNDTVVTRGWVTNLVKHLENDNSYGMCGAVTNSIGNEAMIRVRYTNESEMHKFAYLYSFKHMNQLYLDVDRLAMFCTLIRRSIIEQYGGLDEQYKIGMFEDDDYAQVVMNAGYNMVIAEDSFVHHVNNASFNKLEDKEYKKIFNENRIKYEEKWKTRWVIPKYRKGVTADCNKGMHV